MDPHSIAVTLFRGLTFLGDATFFLLFLPLGYWFGPRRLFARTTVLLIATVLVNSWLKNYFQVPRPSGPHLVEAEGWSFPSGHAQVAAFLWPWLVLELRRPALWPAALLLVAGVAWSRVFLGVHYPTDIAVGTVLGGLIAFIAHLVLTRYGRLWLQLDWRRATWLVSVPLGLFLLSFPSAIDPLTATASGAVFGAAVAVIQSGDHHMERTLRFPSRLGRLGALVLGLGVLFGLRAGLKLLFVDLDPSLANFLRYSVIGAWLASLAPAAFCALGLAHWQPLEGSTDGIATEGDDLSMGTEE